MTTLEMIQGAKRYAKSPLLSESALTTEVDSSLPISSWVRWLNDSIYHHMNITIGAAQEYFGALKTISFVADQQEYSLPGDSIEIRLVERTDASVDRVISPVLINDRTLYSNPYSDYDPLLRADYTYIWGNMLGFTPTPTTAATNNINVLYIRRLPEINYGTAASVAADGTTITLAATPTFGASSNEDDYYNNATIQIVSASTYAGQRRKITDYVGSTRVCTLETAISVPTGTIVYDIVCDIPAQFHPAVVMWTAIQAKVTDDDSITQISSIYKELKDRMVAGLIPRQSQEPRRVHYIPDFGYDY